MKDLNGDLHQKGSRLNSHPSSSWIHWMMSYLENENQWWLKLIDKELHYDNPFVWIYGTDNKFLLFADVMILFYLLFEFDSCKIFGKQTFVKSESCIYVYKYHFSCYSIQLQHCHLIVYINLQLTNAIYSIAKNVN